MEEESGNGTGAALGAQQQQKQEQRAAQRAQAEEAQRQAEGAQRRQQQAVEARQLHAKEAREKAEQQQASVARLAAARLQERQRQAAAQGGRPPPAASDEPFRPKPPEGEPKEPKTDADRESQAAAIASGAFATVAMAGVIWQLGSVSGGVRQAGPALVCKGRQLSFCGGEREQVTSALPGNDTRRLSCFANHLPSRLEP
jgi:hypothetical protein